MVKTQFLLYNHREKMQGPYTDMIETSCPECASRLRLGAHPHQRQRIICPGCDTNLVIVSLNPLEVDVAMPANNSAGLKKKSNRVEVPCPECDHPITLSIHVHEGQPVTCDRCHASLEVVSIDPLELDIAMTINFKRNRDRKVEKEKLNKKGSDRARKKAK
jgi:lysine biosynthesis protein LysW